MSAEKEGKIEVNEQAQEQVAVVDVKIEVPIVAELVSVKEDITKVTAPIVKH